MQDYHVKCKLQIVAGKHIHTETHDLCATPKELERRRLWWIRSSLFLYVLKVTFRESLAHQSVFYHFLCVSTVNKNRSVIG